MLVDPQAEAVRIDGGERTEAFLDQQLEGAVGSAAVGGQHGR